MAALGPLFSAMCAIRARDDAPVDTGQRARVQRLGVLHQMPFQLLEAAWPAVAHASSSGTSAGSLRRSPPPWRAPPVSRLAGSPPSRTLASRSLERFSATPGSISVTAPCVTVRVDTADVVVLRDPLPPRLIGGVPQAHTMTRQALIEKFALALAGRQRERGKRDLVELHKGVLSRIGWTGHGQGTGCMFLLSPAFIILRLYGKKSP